MLFAGGALNLTLLGGATELAPRAGKAYTADLKVRTTHK